MIIQMIGRDFLLKECFLNALYYICKFSDVWKSKKGMKNADLPTVHFSTFPQFRI